jgi:hypothetical protein
MQLLGAEDGVKPIDPCVDIAMSARAPHAPGFSYILGPAFRICPTRCANGATTPDEAIPDGLVLTQ